LPNVHVDINERLDSDVVDEAKRVQSSNADLKILNLKKKSFGKFRAVDGMTLSMNKGQVFALLGHNGAGKTTTINMLTGALTISSGDAVVFGKSITNQLDEVQEMLGVCPQHNILWDELSSAQHLEIFSRIKGVSPETRTNQIEEALKSVLLFNVKDKPCGKYSGGMKRRLSVAISSIGDPKVIYLDEPTTGLDPMSRRHIWTAIQRLKENRIVILTTHSMEEADLLGDRVGIMASGNLQCIGTSLHLKNKFGLGYRLNIIAQKNKQDHAKKTVQETVPNAVLIQDSGLVSAYAIKKKDLELLIPLIKKMEKNEISSIEDYSISQSTLEEVFFKVTDAEKQHV